MTPWSETKELTNLLALRSRSKASSALIHCLTNPISIHDMANVILSLHQKPIMAEYPLEVEQITPRAGALLINLGNITKDRMAAMKLSIQAAANHHIPVIIDLVGIAASTPRLELAMEFVHNYSPALIKGNYTEILSLYREQQLTGGVDAREGDEVYILEAVKALSAKGHHLAATGKIDYIAGPEGIYTLSNGNPQMARITGTGCILGGMMASFLPYTDSPYQSALLATLMMGIAGEKAYTPGIGLTSYSIALMDQIDLLTDEDIKEKKQWAKIL